MPRILVTGGAGYIGSHTVHLLLRRGYDVVVVDNLCRGHAHNVPPERLRRLSLQDTDALTGLLRDPPCAAVIHFAAYIAVGESMEKPELYFANNVGGSLSLVSAMLAAGVDKLVFSSTAAVYGMPERVPVTEEAPFAPVSPYGESKVMVEKMLGWLDQCRGLRSVSLRYFNACGADPEAGLGEEHDPETHLVPLLLRAVRTGEPVTIFGDDYDTPDGTCIRDYIHVSDLAEAHAIALESLLAGAPSAAYNAGTGQGHSVLEVVRAVEEVTGRTVPRRIGPRRPGDAPVLVADPSRLRAALGWRPGYTDLRDIVATAWEFECRRAACRPVE
ncbi:MAG: UDP-glucose 4-epimerase GalE [Bryobacterales bacterium]|nr:UDP-glucose 4-epimerase GalE [Bryobacteraceae bacterium]MDW8355637.1 UDP-glucose 4-epimerase GalE [Bryobacterales bacterium]